ncbi:MAG: hypothetical protein M1833_006436 [Piccolia ochrophora]|nr:MAG: hypothetical protein M1833_006436 [Piccolia ochrophora]
MDMEMHVDPRLRSTTAASSVSAQTGRLPPLPNASLAENPVHLPPPAQTRAAAEVPPLSDANVQQHPYYDLPRTPPSNNPNGTSDSATDPKRPRACEACRGLKVRCEPDDDPDEPCKRCRKAGRHCVVTMPSRKRQKKTDSRVAELEKKIDALTASLHATQSGAEQRDSESEATPPNDRAMKTPYQRQTQNIKTFTPPNPTAISQDVMSGAPWPTTTENMATRSPEQTSKPALRAPNAVTGLKRRHSEENGEQQWSSRGASESTGFAPVAASSEGTPSQKEENTPTNYPFLMPKRSRSTAASASTDRAPPSVQNSSSSYEYADVIDRRILSSELAASFFDRYINDMATHFPAVVFAPGTTAAEIRKTRPILFLAILSVGSGASRADLQRTLTNELMKVLADRIICTGDKSLELIQALHVATLWYWPPDHMEELKFYQLIHIAAVMALDIGLGKKNRSFKQRNPVASVWRAEHSLRRNPLPYPESVESRRTWLSCYFLSAGCAQSLRRPNLIRWSSHMQECIDVLESSPDALQSDKILCQWVRLQRIVEEVSIQFSMDDPSARIGGISDLKIQYALKGFERQLEDWNSQLPKELETQSLRLSAHVTNLYMHEVAMHVDHNIDDFRPPFTEDHLKNSQNTTDLLTPAHIGALSSCLDSVHGIFNTFLSNDVEYVRTLPIFNFVRIAYAVVVLTKMYFAVTAPNSELGKVISKDDLRIERYLDGLLEKYRAVAEDDKCRAASKFLMVLVMLKTWFQKQKGTISNEKFSSKMGATLAAAMSTGGVTANCPGKGHKDGQNGSTIANTRASSEYPSTMDSDGGQTQPDYASANTPLHMLSEVAMGNSNGMQDGSSMNPVSNTRAGTDAAPLPMSFYPFGSAEGAGGSTTLNYSTGSAAGVPPSYDAGQAPGLPEAGLEASMGDGFGQAMGITLGDQDLSSIFMDDVFLNFNMDGTPNMYENWAS